MSKFEVGQEYDTRGGLRARIYATDGDGGEAIHGAVLVDDVWRLKCWRADGRHYYGCECSMDLIPPPPVVSEALVNAFKHRWLYWAADDLDSRIRNSLSAALTQYEKERKQG